MTSYSCLSVKELCFEILERILMMHFRWGTTLDGLIINKSCDVATFDEIFISYCGLCCFSLKIFILDSNIKELNSLNWYVLVLDPDAWCHQSVEGICFFFFLFEDERAMLKWLSICKRSIELKILCGLCKNNSWHGCSMAVDQLWPISKRNSWQFLWMFVLWVRTIAINLYISLFSLNPKGLFSGLKVSCAIKCAWDLLQVFYIVVICWFSQYHC